MIAGCGGETAGSSKDGPGGGPETGGVSSSSAATGGAAEVTSDSGGTAATSSAGATASNAGTPNSGGIGGTTGGSAGAVAAVGGAGGKAQSTGGVAGAAGSGGSSGGSGGAPNDPSCPSDWSGLTTGGYPNVCAVSGVICWYPDGQAICSPDGSALKWWTNGPYTNCSEFPPETGTKCSNPGSVCEYITGPPSMSNSVAIYCCDGNDSEWDIQSGGCPNGNVCGTIHAADYDQTCSKDSDCVGVTEGDLCTPNTCSNCTNAAVNAGAESKYDADFASKDSTPVICPCPSGPPIGCKNGMCAITSE